MYRHLQAYQPFPVCLSMPAEATTEADSFRLRRSKTIIVCSPFNCADMSATKGMQTLHPVQLCIFDAERDYPEGEEARQILAYHPEDCSIHDQTSVVGLAQALLTFTGNFDEAGAHSVVSCGSCKERRV
jgi:hypothetical protein